jgi:selT/selW/selH-like putative selenoprotein
MEGRARIEIAYCVPCGYLPMATWMASELDREFPNEVAIALVPSDKGRLEVTINGTVVYDYKTISNRTYPDYDAVTRMRMTLREMVGEPA